MGGGDCVEVSGAFLHNWFKIFLKSLFETFVCLFVFTGVKLENQLTEVSSKLSAE